MGSLFRALLLVLAPLGIATPECDPEALDDQKQQKQHALLSLHPQSPHFDGDPPLPRTGFDCAGLVAHVFKRAWKLSLPRRVDQQAKLGKPVSRHALRPGDLVFYNTHNSAFSHVGIYLGDDRFVHAPRRGQPIRVERVDHPYWAARFSGARRLAPPV